MHGRQLDRWVSTDDPSLPPLTWRWRAVVSMGCGVAPRRMFKHLIQVDELSALTPECFRGAPVAMEEDGDVCKPMWMVVRQVCQVGRSFQTCRRREFRQVCN